MSEDSAEITFKVKKDNLIQAESLVRKCGEISGANDIQTNFSRGKFKGFFEFIECDSDFFDALNKMHQGLHSLVAEEIVTKVYFEQVGESDYYKSYGKKIQRFGSLKELKEYEKELNSKVDISKLSFKKNSLDDTALARFHCPSQSKRNKLLKLFEELIIKAKGDRLNYFSEHSKQLLKSTKYHEVKWCAYRSIDSENSEPPGQWWEGIPELIVNIDFISEQGDYFFVGFDVATISFLQECPYDMPHENGFRWDDNFENTIFHVSEILTFLDGVKDVMVKYRLTNFPNGEYQSKTYNGFRSRRRSKDDNWVLPGAYANQNGK